MLVQSVRVLLKLRRQRQRPAALRLDDEMLALGSISMSVRPVPFSVCLCGRASAGEFVGERSDDLGSIESAYRRRRDFHGIGSGRELLAFRRVTVVTKKMSIRRVPVVVVGRRSKAPGVLWAVMSEVQLDDLAKAKAVVAATPPTEKQLMRVAKKLQETEDWTKVLPGLARLSLEQDEGMTYKLRIVKSKEAMPVRVVRPGEDGAADAASILKVSELDSWCFNFKELISRAGVTSYEGEALVFLLGLKDDEDCFKVFELSKQIHGRYSGRALALVRDAKSAGRIEEARAAFSQHRRARQAAKKAAKV